MEEAHGLRGGAGSRGLLAKACAAGGLRVDTLLVRLPFNKGRFGSSSHAALRGPLHRQRAGR